MNEVETFLRLAKGHVDNALMYAERLPESPGLDKLLKSLSASLERIDGYAEKNGIRLRQSMRT